jgi:heptosyltransferase-2
VRPHTGTDARARVRRAALAVAGVGLASAARALAMLPLAPRRTGAPPSLAGAGRVVVVRADELGDVVMTTAFLRELRRAAPAAHVTLVVNRAARPLVDTCPYVDRVVTFDTAVPRARRAFVLPWRAWRIGRAIRRAGVPDLTLLPRRGTDAVFATVLAFATGASHRVGFSEAVDPRKRRLNRGFDALLTCALPFDGWGHEVAHTLTLLGAAGARAADDALELWPDAADASFAAGVLAGLGAAGRPVVALCPSGGHSALKQWSPVRFAALADRLREELDASVVLVGGPDDRALADAVAASCSVPPISFVGRTTLRQLAAVVERCALFVGNDAGPMHIAAAVGTAVVAVFGASDPTRFGPWRGRGSRGNARVVWHPPPCAPVFRADRPDRCPQCVLAEPVCLTGIGVDEVLDACRAALGRAALPAPATPTAV